MTALEILARRNADFAARHTPDQLRRMLTLGVMVVGCVDPRVDPAHVLGLELGEAAVIRNVGGRITPATLQTMALLGLVAQADGFRPRGETTLVVLHHTDCGITRLAAHPDRLAAFFGVAADELPAKAVTDPRAAVAADVALLTRTTGLPAGWQIAGLVYDVDTGLVEVVVPPAKLSAA